jgi:hypothetical protein
VLMRQGFTTKKRKSEKCSRRGVDMDDNGGTLRASRDKKPPDDNSRNLPIRLLTSDVCGL